MHKHLAALSLVALSACTPALGRMAMNLPEPTIARDCADRLWPRDGSRGTACSAAIPANDPARRMAAAYQQSSPIARSIR
jgi:hypothetical protein